MKLKTSLFKKGLIISDLKRFWWISALYTLVLFFAVPFYHYVQKLNTSNDSVEWVKKLIANDLSFKGGINQAFLLIVPVVIGALVFRYIQKSRSASLYHSLPLTRAVLYFNSVLSALILFVAPLLCTTLIMLLLNWFSSLSAFYSSMLIFTWLLYSLLFGIMFIAMSVFVGMFTGSSIAQLAFVYILNLLPMFLVEFVRMSLREILFGFDTYSNVSFYDKMPVTMVFRIGSIDSPTTVIIVYIAVTIALFIGGLFAFKLRKPETAGDIITFRPIRPVFIYGVTICATLLGGAYFILSTGRSSFTFIIFGYVISSLISYVIVQMITNKSFKILHTYKGYIGFALVLVVLALGIKFDVIGYVNKVPAPSEVEETYVGQSLYWWENKDNPDFDLKDYDNYNANLYKDTKNIENITKLHKLILDKRSTGGNSQYVAYKLKNGKHIIRRYPIDTDLYTSVLSPIYQSKEYKEGRFPILYQAVNDLKYIDINDERAQKNPFVVSDKAKLEGFKAAITKDIENLSYQDLVSNSRGFQKLLYIDIIDTKERTINYALRSSYTNTLDWLKKEGIYEQIVLQSEDVDSVMLRNYDKSESKEVEITDKVIIKEILDLSLDADYNDRTMYLSIGFTKSRNSRQFDFPIVYDKVSPGLKSYLDQIK
ncbi:MAG: DUF6449 domain-containing protein [Ruminiclostridium sp.]